MGFTQTIFIYLVIGAVVAATNSTPEPAAEPPSSVLLLRRRDPVLAAASRRSCSLGPGPKRARPGPRDAGLEKRIETRESSS